MKLVIAAVVICGALACEYSSFDDFASKYGKSYTDDEVDVRRTNWEMAKAEIAAHNARVSSWTAGLNEFSDMSWEEYDHELESSGSWEEYDEETEQEAAAVWLLSCTTCGSSVCNRGMAVALIADSCQRRREDGVGRLC